LQSILAQALLQSTETIHSLTVRCPLDVCWNVQLLMQIKIVLILHCKILLGTEVEEPEQGLGWAAVRGELEKWLDVEQIKLA